MILHRECLPTPLAAWKSIVEMLGEGTLFVHFGISLQRMLLGMLFGMLFSLPTGLILGYLPKINLWIGELFNFLYVLPKVVFLPVIIVVMGIGDLPKVFLIALVLFFQQTIVIRDAVKKIPEEYFHVIKVWKPSKLSVLHHLIIPACLPDVMTSLRMSISTSIALLFITENFASFTGLGYYITACMDRRDYDEMYAAIIALAIMGCLLYWCVGKIERYLCGWKDGR
jgi:NitT/TauT family transport system permease protein